MGRIVDIAEVLLELGLSSTVTDEERAVTTAAIARGESAVKRYLRYDPTQVARTEFYPRANMGRTSAQGVWEANENQAYFRQVSEASTAELQVQHIPIRSSPAVILYIDYNARSGTQSGAFAAETLKVEGTDFWPNYDGEDSSGNSICRDGIIRSFGLWPVESGSVKLVYTAGYSDEELHGQDAIVDAGSIVDAVIGEAARRAKKVFVNKKSASAGWLAGPLQSESFGAYSYSVDTAALNRLFGSSMDLLPDTQHKLSEFVNMAFEM